uniref:Mediator of RNA polymerase II transcription subunit 28 n=1 Tax=Aotus nancymaae TaxID=37293 RepID=A0A2K5EZL7_AOTNA
MAAPLGGMFSGQPPGPPQPPLDLPGQASLLQAAPGAPRPSNSTLVDELESSFEACFASLVSQDYVSGTDQEEIRTGVDQCIQKQCFLLQKRLQLSVQKPEQVIKEDVSELRNELQRKDALVQKHLTKLRHWQQMLEDINVQHKKPADIPQGSLAYLEQASANIPTPLKPT